MAYFIKIFLARYITSFRSTKERTAKAPPFESVAKVFGGGGGVAQKLGELILSSLT